MAQPLEHCKITKDYHVEGRLWRAGYHTGIDLAAKTGDEVYAVESGRVIYAGRGAGWGPSYGIHVIIELADKTRVSYNHLSRLDLASLKDKRVKEGDRIGYAGATGQAMGSHLHFEAREAPYRYGLDDINPKPYLDLTSGPKPTKAPAKKAAAPKK